MIEKFGFEYCSKLRVNEKNYALLASELGTRAKANG